MGVFGFLGNIANADIRTAILPLAVVDDIYKIVSNQPPNTTKETMKCVGNDLEESANEIIENLF